MNIMLWWDIKVTKWIVLLFLLTYIPTYSGIVLRPRFIYGKRRVGDYEIPLDLIGEPVERFLKAIENFTKPLSSLYCIRSNLGPTC
ncbi:hypothetical protein Lalb_Chr05g0215771 [Lupinus albus]|uniref:Uncharacterized protein n=1 Tax=Lupinus albus TaxID=3870 RepID=A0A6A4QFY5_LUPAL|nr:hypothetical protein Lalb_Chr05g0215771 [Lupinus albus]